MISIMEFIMQNYIWFLVMAIVILLAIIGYYADKTNFGQGNNESNDDNKNSIDIANAGINDIAKEHDISKNKKNTNTNVNSSNLLSNTENIQTKQSDATEIINLELPTSLEIIEPNVANKSLDIEKSNSTKIDNIETTEGKKSAIATAIGEQISVPVNSIKIDENDIIKEKQKEEELKKLDLEIESVLPQEKLINDDLLNEINDLELGKTKKLDLSDLTKFDKIELPRISSSIKNEQDIWRF